MNKCIPQNSCPHITYVCDYNWPIENELKGSSVIVNINRLGDIRHITDGMGSDSSIKAFIYREPFGSLETVDIDPAWADTPIVMYLNHLGKFRNVADKVEQLKGMNITIIFTGAQAQACVDAQILSSLGIHSGVELTPDSELSESLLDLMTYYFYSRLPHAPIEPFATMAHYYTGNNYVSPSLLQLENPARYVHIDAQHRMAFTRAGLLAGNTLEHTADNITSQQLDTEAQRFSDRWQQWFIESHPCTFCPAFRVCKSFFYKEGADTTRCREVMSELLESIEFDKKKHETHRNEPCQL